MDYFFFFLPLHIPGRQWQNLLWKNGSGTIKRHLHSILGHNWVQTLTALRIFEICCRRHYAAVQLSHHEYQISGGWWGVGLGLDCAADCDETIDNADWLKSWLEKEGDHVKDSLIMYRQVTQTVVAVCRWHYFNTASGFCKEVLYIVFSLFSVAEAKMKNQLQHNHELEYTTTFLTLTPAVIINYWVVIMKGKEKVDSFSEKYISSDILVTTTSNYRIRKCDQQKKKKHF